MKRMFVFLSLCILMCATAYSATTCLHNNSVLFVIQQSTDPIQSTVDATNHTFSMTFDYDLFPGRSEYRTIRGESTCNEISTNTSGGAITPGVANTHLRASTADVGTYCWCSFTGPLTTWWVYLNQYETESQCLSSCTSACAGAIKNNTNNFRTNGMYRAIW